MSPHKRLPRLAFGFALLVGAQTALIVQRLHSETFTPFAPQALPQRATGDFDGDGRTDTALIQDRSGDHRLSVQLSGSPSAVHLEASVTGVIEGDIDHDGDLDIVAATPSGDVLIWLNDGHGRFTRQAPSNASGLSGEPVISHTAWPESMAFGVRAPLATSPVRARATVLVTKARPPTALVALDAPATILPTLRAPPARSL